MLMLKDVISKLPIVSENIMEEAANQPLLFKDAARVRVGKMRKRAAAEATFDQYEASRNLRNRTRRDEQGKKPAEGEIKARTAMDPKLIELRKLKDDAFAEEELSKLILESYRQRNSAIKVIAESQNIEGLRESKTVDEIQNRQRLAVRARQLEERRRSLRSGETE